MLTWIVEDIRICLDADPDCSRGPARQIMYALDNLEKKGWSVEHILHMGGADLGEEIVLLCARRRDAERSQKVKARAAKRLTEPKYQPIPKKYLRQKEEAERQRAERLATALEQLAASREGKHGENT